MAKSDFILSSDEQFDAQLQTFKTNIGNYAATLGLTKPQVDAQAADADYFHYILTSQRTMRNGAQQWSSWKTSLRNGGTPPPAGAPVPPAFDPPVPAVGLGVEPRFRALVKLIKSNSNYNPAMGEALGIEGTEQAGPDLATIQPNIDARVVGNQVNIDWGWQGQSAFLDMIELQVDRGGGQGYVFLANDTTPGYVDTTLFPPAPIKWTYRAIYRVGDQQVGQWSKPVSVTVGG